MSSNARVDTILETLTQAYDARIQELAEELRKKDDALTKKDEALTKKDEALMKKGEAPTHCAKHIDVSLGIADAQAEGRGGQRRQRAKGWGAWRCTDLKKGSGS